MLLWDFEPSQILMSTNPDICTRSMTAGLPNVMVKVRLHAQTSFRGIYLGRFAPVVIIIIFIIGNTQLKQIKGSNNRLRLNEISDIELTLEEGWIYLCINQMIFFRPPRFMLLVNWTAKTNILYVFCCCQLSNERASDSRMSQTASVSTISQPWWNWLFFPHLRQTLEKKKKNYWTI